MTPPNSNEPAAVPPPQPAPAPRPEPAAGGLTSALKVAVPVGVLMAVIFAITFFSQYTPQDVGGVKGPESSGEPPLRFFTSTRHWDPYGSLQDRTFPGFYEATRTEAGTPNGAAFWFENRNTKSVTMQLKGVSCSACSGGRVAAIPQDVTRQLLQMTAVSALPGGLFSPLPAGLAGPAANLAEDRLPWQSYVFRDHPHAEYSVPAGSNPDGWSPQWGILELRFSVGAVAPKELKSLFNLQVDGTQQIGSAEFAIAFEGVEPFDLTKTSIDAGELQETSEARTYDVVVYSATRGPRGSATGDLDAPRADVRLVGGAVGEAGPFVSVGPPVRLTEEEMQRVPEEVKRNVRVESAYRMTVTVSPKVGDRRADLGPLERDVHISTADTAKSVRVKALVRGSVWLDNNQKEIAIGNYKYSEGSFPPATTVITDKPAQELVLVRDDPSLPEGLVVELEKQPAAPDLGYYRLKVSVPANAKGGAWAGYIVLELKGPNPQRIRIPVRGNGTR
ncbi:hypothetical protein [Gemmata sp.]|uniref:hypothetical protein n=1 Tax=Gemmata sp. TaxID=1914242 RepID=UPI003F6FE30B